MGQHASHEETDGEVASERFCSLAVAALMWSEESAMWVVDDAVAAVEEGVYCEQALALALRERRPTLVARLARRAPWSDLLCDER